MALPETPTIPVAGLITLADIPAEMPTGFDVPTALPSRWVLDDWFRGKLLDAINDNLRARGAHLHPPTVELDRARRTNADLMAINEDLARRLNRARRVIDALENLNNTPDPVRDLLKRVEALEKTEGNRTDDGK